MTSNRQRFSPEFRERAVRLVQEHEQDHSSRWGAIRSIAEKMGCSAEALRNGAVGAQSPADSAGVEAAIARHLRQTQFGHSKVVYLPDFYDGHKGFEGRRSTERVQSVIAALGGASLAAVCRQAITKCSADGNAAAFTFMRMQIAGDLATAGVFIGRNRESEVFRYELVRSAGSWIVRKAELQSMS